MAANHHILHSHPVSSASPIQVRPYKSGFFFFHDTILSPIHNIKACPRMFKEVCLQNLVADSTTRMHTGRTKHHRGVLEERQGGRIAANSLQDGLQSHSFCQWDAVGTNTSADRNRSGGHPTPGYNRWVRQYGNVKSVLGEKEIQFPLILCTKISANALQVK